MSKAFSSEVLFSSDIEYKKYRSDTCFWKPMIQSAFNTHELENTAMITAGFNSTNPVFLINDYVIKFYGYRKNCTREFENECLAHQLLAQDNRIFTPKLIASGQLFENTAMPWSYIISTKMQGASWLDSDLSPQQQQTVVAELGQQVKYIHDLPLNNAFNCDGNWGELDCKAAARKSSLPEHLIDQVDDFMTTLGPFDRVVVNGDIVSMHVFTKEGHLSGIIDWGDAVITDRHYEIGKLCLSIFPCNKGLLRILLEAANWPLTQNFQRQTLGMTLYRQAVGLTQHFGFDIFYQLPIDWMRIKTLDQLAGQLFNVG